MGGSAVGDVTDQRFLETVAAIDRAPITDGRRHRLMLVAIGCRFLEAGGGIVPRHPEALEIYMTMATDRATSSTRGLTYADIVAELHASQS